MTLGSIYVSAFTVHGNDMLNYNYTLPGNGNGIGTPIMRRTTNGTNQNVSNISSSRNFRIRLRNVANNGSETTISGLINVGSNITNLVFDPSALVPNDQLYDPNDLDAIIANRQWIANTAGYFYLQNYTYTGDPNMNISYTWYLG
ncbi:MAG: hypothetical protein RR664_02030 [Clostridia bacterium]